MAVQRELGGPSLPQERRLVTSVPGPRSLQLQARRDATVARGVGATLPVFVDRAGGGVIVGGDGNSFIDFGAGIAVVSVGTAAPHVSAGVQEHVARYTHTCFMLTPYEPYVAVCEELAALTPGTFAKRSALFNSGAEAVENAVKIARAYTGRQAVIAFDHAYHGRTNLTMALTAKNMPYKHSFGPFAGDIYRMPMAYLQGPPLDRLTDHLGGQVVRAEQRHHRRARRRDRLHHRDGLGGRHLRRLHHHRRAALPAHACPVAHLHLGRRGRNPVPHGPRRTPVDAVGRPLLRFRDADAVDRQRRRADRPRRATVVGTVLSGEPVVGLEGLGLGFPLPVYLFIGWENSAALAEETDNPRRNVPRAVFASIILMAASHVLFSYVTVEGFGQNVEFLGKTEIPFISVADDTLHAFAFFAYLAGLTSTRGVLIAGVNAQARMVFNAGREGTVARRNRSRASDPPYAGCGPVRLPRFLAAARVRLGRAHRPVGVLRSPRRSARSSSSSSTSWPTSGCRSTTGATGRRSSPGSGIAFPLYELVKPGQPAPYNRFPLICAAIIVVAVLYGAVLARRRPGLADRVGSIVADSD